MSEQTVYVQGAGGAVIEMSLPLHETIVDQIEKGFARIVNADGSQIDEAERPTEAPQLVDTRPPLSAPKGDWISWAVYNGANPEDAVSATKQDLIEKYGQTETGTGAHRTPTGSIRVQAPPYPEA